LPRLIVFAIDVGFHRKKKFTKKALALARALRELGAEDSNPYRLIQS